MVAKDYLKLGNVELNSDGIFIQKDGLDFPEPEREKVDFSYLDADGEEIVSRRYKNAIRTIGLEIVGSSYADLKSKVDSIVAEVAKEGNVLEFRPANATTIYYSDIVHSKGTTRYRSTFWNANLATMVLTLEAKPFWRSDARKNVLLINYIRNSSLERDSDWDGVPNHWGYFCSNTTINPSYGLLKVGWPPGYHGKYAFTLEASGGTGTGYSLLSQSLYGFRPGEILTLSGYFKTVDAINGSYFFVVAFYNEAGTLIGSTTVMSTTAGFDWTRYSKTFTVPTGTYRTLVRIELHITAVGGEGRLSADAIQLERKDSASTYYLGTTLIPNPTTLTLTELAGEGTLPAGTYSYRLYGCTEHGETGSVGASITIAVNSAVKLDWTHVPGAKRYKIHYDTGRFLTEVGRVSTWTHSSDIAKGAAVTISEVNSAYTNFNPTVFSFSETAVEGDVSPLVRLYILSNTTDLSKIWVGYRSQNIASEPILKFEAEDGEQTGWTETSLAGYSGGKGIARTMTAEETSLATGFSKKMSRVKGKYKILLKAESTAAEEKAVFRYLIKSGAAAYTFGKWIPVASNIIADLGDIEIPSHAFLESTDPLQYVFIQAKNNDTVSRTFYVDYFILFPLEEGMAYVKAIIEDGNALIIDSAEGISIWKQLEPFINPTDTFHSLDPYSIFSDFKIIPKKKGWIVVLTAEKNDFSERHWGFDFGIEYIPRYLQVR